MLSPADSLAPEWLVEPDDANDLADGVWPASAIRDVDGALVLAGLSATALVQTYGTPLLVIDEDEVRTRARAFRSAFDRAAAEHGTTAQVYYAGKAFLCTTIARWVVDEGLRVDVCTGGELEVALAAGVAPAAIGFHGNNKSTAELQRAVDVGVGSIIVDSEIEIERLSAITARTGAVQRVFVRVISGVHAETHDFLATAHEDQKFGFPLPEAEKAVARIREIPGLDFAGLHCHIGSQIFGVAGFRESASRVLELHATLLEGGPVPQLNLGGGFGIAYTRVDDPTPIEELAAEIVAAVAQGCDARGIAIPALSFEPGRAIVGTAGVTLYEVGTTKDVTVESGAVRRYISVDGGMSDNARPALYGAQFSARLASRVGDGSPQLSRVVGKHCESGDIVVDHEYLPGDLVPGDLLAVPATGAYCVSLASNYNHVPRPPVIAVRDGKSRVIVRGETIDDLLARDAGIDGGRESDRSRPSTSEGAR
ncbi:diaminopimelate decarboxylase [Microbacterium saperdae]|uniref:Diaminopimelate decarboxylase n=1 Tax=Microbacterium saperdae TaxID=69368 RepID=A0A543BNX2_9MICO|nr:diaminopimelate decarboxylase [Microbacterium saperdae]TQL86529.1 diaminopimelate decarboxylase [Microbacterium saperdae]GGM47349.1 diaminopimelate decarboxylase [Microbacterium saperdae]